LRLSISPKKKKSTRKDQNQLSNLLNTQVKLIETAGDIDEFTDDEQERILEEALKAKALPNCRLPCHSEVEQHNITHLPFRDWCPYCVQGKAASYPHRKRKDEESDVAVISSDYMGLKHREPEEGNRFQRPRGSQRRGDGGGAQGGRRAGCG
jgi:hypothetical protein